MAENSYNFAVNLFQAVSKKQTSEKNIFISPYSISTVLSTLLLGAKENTASELETVLQSDSSFNIHSQQKEILNRLSKINKSVTLSCANKLFIEESFQLSKQFLDDCLQYYDTDVESVKFFNDSNNSRIHINNWVEKKTNDKIKDLIPPNGIDSLTRLVIVNALYFKGDWKNKFNSKETQMANFYVSKSNPKKIQMMTQKSKFMVGHNKDLDVQIIKLPYKNDAVSMIILLPNDRFGLELLEKKVSIEKLQELEEQCFSQEVILSLPKFRIEDSVDLKPILKSLGVCKAFDVKEADFSGITNKPDLFVSDVFHKTFVEVNEEGTEAAAATAAVMVLRSLPLKPIRIICDHPFIFLIQHNLSKAILFFGRLVNP